MCAKVPIHPGQGNWIHSAARSVNPSSPGLMRLYGLHVELINPEPPPPCSCSLSFLGSLYLLDLLLLFAPAHVCLKRLLFQKQDQMQSCGWFEVEGNRRGQKDMQRRRRGTSTRGLGGGRRKKKAENKRKGEEEQRWRAEQRALPSTSFLFSLNFRPQTRAPSPPVSV